MILNLQFVLAGFLKNRSVTYSSPLDLSQQLILVISPDWRSTSASLHRFERSAPGGTWFLVDQPIVVSLGRSGMAWGCGLHSPQCATGPVKREGDGCAPAGVFSLPALFGKPDSASEFVMSLKLPYLSATTDLKCIDDPESHHYNRIIEAQSVSERDWSSHEEMLRQDDCYSTGVVVGHNVACVPGAGSCIFMHVWRGEGASTEGCTAMPVAHMEEICRWLDAGCHPVLVQLPALEYVGLRDEWCLPKVSDSILLDR